MCKRYLLELTVVYSVHRNNNPNKNGESALAQLGSVFHLDGNRFVSACHKRIAMTSIYLFPSTHTTDEKPREKRPRKKYDEKNHPKSKVSTYFVPFCIPIFKLTCSNSKNIADYLFSPLSPVCRCLFYIPFITFGRFFPFKLIDGLLEDKCFGCQ